MTSMTRRDRLSHVLVARSRRTFVGPRPRPASGRQPPYPRCSRWTGLPERDRGWDRSDVRGGQCEDIARPGAVAASINCGVDQGSVDDEGEPMARAIWTGYLSFGLVVLPV